MMEGLNQQGYEKALDLLRRASTPAGFVAAIEEEDNYRRVWTRDSALCGLAALSTGDPELSNTYRLSIETILAQQHEAGFIPSNVSPVTGKASYGHVVGRVDNHAWIVISACQWAKTNEARDWLHQYEPALRKSLALLTAWEFNGRGLVYVPQSADWADEYLHHGYILYNQLLRLWALRCAALMLDESYANEAARVQEAVERWFGGQEFYAPQLQRMWNDQTFPYWIMGFNPGHLYTQFDLQANALALLLGIGTNSQRERLLLYLRTHAEMQKLLPSFLPAIGPGDEGYDQLRNNFAYRFRNHPQEFHNGGLWPVWNGFAALAISEHDPMLAQHLCDAIASLCAQDNWQFNECYHGTTGEGIGVPHCAWSAAGLILATHTGLRNRILT